MAGRWGNGAIPGRTGLLSIPRLQNPAERGKQSLAPLLPLREGPERQKHGAIGHVRSARAAAHEAARGLPIRRPRIQVRSMKNI